MVEATFDSYAKLYIDKFNFNLIGRYQRRRVHRQLAEILEPGMAVLDVGCGPGSDFGWYGSRGLQVTAIDISGEMIKLAREESQKTGLDAIIHKAGFLEMAEDQRFDAIVFNFGVINAMADLPAVHQKLRKLLLPGGSLVIVTMPAFHLFSFLADVMHLRARTLYQRLVLRRQILPGGMTLYYHRTKAIIDTWHLCNRLHLASIMPTPDQYAARPELAKRLFNFLKPVDKAFESRVPAWFGGDHIFLAIREYPPGKNVR